MNQPTVSRANSTRPSFSGGSSSWVSFCREKMASLLFAGLLSLSATAQAAEYYTWIDENGVTNFSQRGPQSGDASVISKGSRPGQQTPADNARPKPIPEPEPANPEVDPDTVIAEQRAAVAAKIAEQKAANCEIGKRNLTSLEMYERIRVMGEDGKERLLSDAEKAERMATARQTIREYCTG